MIIAGFGFSSRASVRDLEEALVDAAEAARIEPEDVDVAVTLAGKHTSRIFRKFAERWDVMDVGVTHKKAAAVALFVPTQSRRSDAAVGLPSLAECTALAFGGEGARFILPRITAGPVTCALVRNDIAFEDAFPRGQIDEGYVIDEWDDRS